MMLIRSCHCLTGPALFKRFGLSLLFAFCSFLSLHSQTFTARPGVNMSTNIHGFYEYLPQGYDPGGTTTYPVIIAFHGYGERGDGGATDLAKIIQPGKGLASLLNTGSFPGSFTVNSQTYRFIILCPQVQASFPDVSEGDVDQVISYAINNYKADINRVYLTGLSMGGGLVWEYASNSTTNANRVAAIVPICGAVLDPNNPVVPNYASTPVFAEARNITAANLPVWATHNQGDNVVPVSYTNNYISYINTAPPPTPLARATIFTTWTDAHDAWTQTYDPAFEEAGLNIYEWMLQYQRSLTSLPVSLSEYRAFKSSATKATIAWTSQTEENSRQYILERSGNGTNFVQLATIPSRGAGQSYSFTDATPLEGKNFYRLSQQDADGRLTHYPILPLQFSKGASSLHLYPNPAKDTLYIQWVSEDKGPVTFSLTNAAGKTVQAFIFQKTDEEWNQMLDISSLPPGLYFVEVKGKNGEVKTRVVKGR